MTVEATFMRWPRHISVRVIASDEVDRIAWERRSSFANNKPARREAVRWCRRLGVTHYRIQ